MRLIDADKLIDALGVRDCHKYKNPKAYDTLMLYEILQAIEDQPTAYDVDKVAEELLVESHRHDHIFGSTIDVYDLGKSHAYRDAIDIVKRGGVDEN